MVENNRKPIASLNMFPQFTTMNVIDGQAGVIIYSSLICHSLTIDNILNIIVLLILARISISMISGNNSILSRTGNAKENTENASMIEQMKMKVLGCYDESAKPNMAKLKIDLESMGANVIGDKFPVTATISEKNIQ